MAASIKAGKAADVALLDQIAARFGVRDGLAQGDFSGEMRLDGLKVTISVRFEVVLPTDQNAEHRRAAMAALRARAELGSTEFHCRSSIAKRGFGSPSTCSRHVAFAMVRKNTYRPAEYGEFAYTFVCGTHRKQHQREYVACVALVADDLRQLRDLGRRRALQHSHARGLLVRDPDRLTCQMAFCDAATDHVQMTDADPSRQTRPEVDAAMVFYCPAHHAADTWPGKIVFTFSKWELEDVHRYIEHAVERERATAERKRKDDFKAGLKVVP